MTTNTETVNYDRAIRTYGACKDTLSAIVAMLTAFHVAMATEREVEVEVHTVQPQTVIGRLVSFSLGDGAVLQAGEEKRHVPALDIIRMIKRLPAPPSATEAEPEEQLKADPARLTVTLTWGDVLTGRVVDPHRESDNEIDRRANGEKKARAGASVVVIETADLGEVAIPIEAVARIRCSNTAVHRDAVQWLERGKTSAERAVLDDDRVLLTNGDLLRGFISAIAGEGIVIDTGTGPTTVPYRLVVAARLAPAVPADAPAEAMGRPPEPYLLVTLRDGARVTAKELDIRPMGPLESSRWELKLRIGPTVHGGGILGPIESLELIGGRWEWLTDHRPISYEQSPMLGPGWEFAVDRSVTNGPILVGGERYERGIGVHSRSVLIFELNGEYREFVTSFGMDDNSGPMGDVTVLVLVDGQRRFEKAHVRRGTLIGPVRVDVSHAGRIELIVEFGDNGDLQDRFDWVEPGLIRN